ncbi:PREDICTED: uncharacterized protein At4g04775-like [Camelina sativa]|uniref:Uncharacterized protein At4g04775-like n=1 Tax=Camelina sativa TaxID=90675 RepID=A0ABM0X4U0_CAMSA|nr:PREDICTED: uncharacterized protein At4g04775-like [Camelina sativa]
MSALANTSPVEYDDAEYGIPAVCYCGERPNLQPSFTRTNPGRLHYTCRNREDGDYHIFKWWDEAMMEELKTVKEDLLKLTSLNQMREALQGQKEEIANILNMHKENQMELERMKALIAYKSDGLTMELKLTNVFVATLVILATMTYFLK